jgi:hypothetical protein
MHDLGTLGGAQSFASDITNAGLVVGRAFDSTDTPRGFVWTAQGGMRQLPGGDPFSLASAAAPGTRGPIAGSAGLPLVPGRWRALGAPFTPFALPRGFEQGQAAGINARGDVVGSASSRTGLVRGFFRTAGGSMLQLRAPGIENSEAAAVSNSLRVVGTAYDDPFFLTSAWLARRPGGPVQLLLRLVPASAGWSFAYANSVNDLGQIAGTGLHAGLTRGYLLVPNATEQAASLGTFKLGGRSFHQRVKRALSAALADVANDRKSRACGSLKTLQRSSRRERTLPKPVRGIFAADVHGFRRTLRCRGA